MKKTLLILLLMLSTTPSSAQIVLVTATRPGDVTYMSFSNAPGAGVVHPVITLKDGTACDMTDPVCIVKAENDFGREIWDTYRDHLRRLAGIK